MNWTTTSFSQIERNEKREKIRRQKANENSRKIYIKHAMKGLKIYPRTYNSIEYKNWSYRCIICNENRFNFNF